MAHGAGGASGVRAERGYLTTCSPGDWPLAVDWALALRGDGIPVGAMIGDRVRAVATPAELDVFDHLVAEPPGTGKGYRAILAIAEATPYASTFFMQTDVRAFSSPAAVFDRLEGEGFALQGEFLAPDDPRWIYGVRVRDLTAACPTPRYLKCQSGVIWFEKERGREILAEAEAAAVAMPGRLRGGRRALVRRIMADEWFLGIAAGRRHEEVATIGYPVPMAWTNHGLTATTRRTPLLHLTTLPAPSLMARWLRDARTARVEAGLVADASLPAWVANLRRSAVSEHGWMGRGPVAKLRRFRRWWRAVRGALEAGEGAVDLASLAREDEWERRHGWADGEQRVYPPATGSSDGLGRRLAEGAGVRWAGARVVDLGCGPDPGPDASRGAREWTGVDPFAPARSGAGPCVRACAAELPVPDASVDIVTAIDVLDRTVDLPSALAEIDRVLAPGGALVALLRVEHYPDFGPVHALRWNALREALRGWAWPEEAHLEIRGQSVRGGLEDARPFDFGDPSCRPGVLVAVGVKPGS